MENFKYAPGLPGYGTKGVDGSAGLSGLATYFTSYDGQNDSTIINSKIQNNKILFATDSYLAGYPDRVYQIGDMIIDKNGKVYDIDGLGASASYTYTESQLNTSGLFIVNDEYDNTFTRYSNDYATQRYLIDDVLTTGSISNYTLTPSSIYGFSADKFAKIKFSNYTEALNDYNPFEVYTSGEGINDAVAIVRDYINNVFRIGNLDASGDVRDTHIIFDASSIKVSKGNGGEYNHDTESGNLLTNYEITGNYLFDPNFSSEPSSFNYDVIGTTDVSIYWDLTHFLNSQSISILNNVNADLYFYPKDITYNEQIINFSSGLDASNYKPIILHNLDTSGMVQIANLGASSTFEAYIRFSSNGWLRDSERLNITTGTVESLTTVPSSFSSISKDGDTEDSIITSTFIWGGTDGSLYTDDSAMLSWVPDGSAAGISNLHITVSVNAGSARTGHIYIPSATVGTKTITLNQSGITPTLSVSPTDQNWDYLGDPCPASTPTITVTANVGNEWIASSNQEGTWCHVTSGEGTGNGSFDVTVDYNGSGSRQATITISSDAADDYVYVEQTANGENCP